MFKIEWLHTLRMVVTHNGFTEAARILDCTPMALSKHVSQLESLVGEPLLRRSTRTVSLTEFGALFLERAIPVLDENESLYNWVRSKDKKPAGTLKLLGHEHSTFLLIIPWIPEFLEKYPDIHIEIDYVTDEINLNKHIFDIAWGISDYLGELYPGLIRKKLFDIIHGIFSSPAYLAKHGYPKSPEDLASLNLIGYPRNNPSNRLLVMTEDNEEDELPYLEMNNSINSTIGAIDLVVHGCGISNFATCIREVQEHMKAGTLVPILRENWWSKGEAFMYWHKVKGDQPKVRVFVDFFMEKLQTWIEETDNFE